MVMEEKNNIIASQATTQSLYQDACVIIDQAKETAYRQVNETLIKRNWLLGFRIQHEVLKDKRAEYGEQVVKNLANALIKRYGRGFSMRNLYNFVSFYQNHQDIFHAVSRKSENILQSLTAKYLTYMPTKEELRREIEQQKEFFRLQNEKWGGRVMDRSKWEYKKLGEVCDLYQPKTISSDMLVPDGNILCMAQMV